MASFDLSAGTLQTTESLQASAQRHQDHSDHPGCRNRRALCEDQKPRSYGPRFPKQLYGAVYWPAAEHLREVLMIFLMPSLLERFDRSVRAVFESHLLVQRSFLHQERVTKIRKTRTYSLILTQKQFTVIRFTVHTSVRMIRYDKMPRTS